MAIIEFYSQENLADDTLLVNAYCDLAFISWRISPQRLDSLARIAYEKSLAIDYAYGKANSIFLQGFSRDLLGEFDSALVYYFDALEMMENLNQEKKIAIINEYIGIVYRYKGDYARSMNYYLKAQDLYEKQQDSLRIGNTYNSIGNLFFDRSEFKKAEEYYLKALEIKRKYASPNSIANTLGNLATIKNQLNKDREEALAMSREVVRIKKSINDLYGLSIAYMTLSNSFENLNRLDSALYYVEKSVEIDRKLTLNEALSGDLRQAARVYIKLNRLELARKYLDEAKAAAILAGSPNNLKSIYQEYAKLDTLSGNYQRGFRNYLKAEILNDSIFNDETKSRIAVLEAEYDFEKEKDSIRYANERERLLLESELIEQKESNIRIIILLAALAVITGLIFWLYRARTQSNKKLKSLNDAATKQKEQLEILVETKDRMLSVIAHDLRGPMSIYQGSSFVIRDLLKHKEYDELINFGNYLEENSIRITQLLDNLLNWALEQGNRFSYHPEKVNLKQAVTESLDLFAPLAEIKGIKLTSEIDEDKFVWADKNSMLGIIRNLVNNAIKFTPENGHVSIDQIETPKFVGFTVKDTGTGIPKEKLDTIFEMDSEKVTRGTMGEKGSGLGLSLVYDFVRVNKGKITVESSEGKGSTFTVLFPF